MERINEDVMDTSEGEENRWVVHGNMESNFACKDNVNNDEGFSPKEKETNKLVVDIKNSIV